MLGTQEAVDVETARGERRFLHIPEGQERKESSWVHRRVGTSAWPWRVLQGGGGVSEERLMGHQNRQDVALWTLSLGHEPRKEEMLTFVRFHERVSDRPWAIEHFSMMHTVPGPQKLCQP